MGLLNVPAVPGVPQHCETVLPNHECQYIAFGCTGCRISRTEDLERIRATVAKVNRGINQQVTVMIESLLPALDQVNKSLETFGQMCVEAYEAAGSPCGPSDDPQNIRAWLWQPRERRTDNKM